MTDRFDKEAAEWDNNADINLINETIASKILPSILTASDTVLELGCGTGLLTFRYYRFVSAWLGVDTASGMIDMLHSKIARHEGAREIVEARKLFLERPDQLDTKYDWGVSSMTFHHIPDMYSTIDCLAGCVTKGLVIVDYASWDGSRVFHPEEKMTGVERHGLDAQVMVDMCKRAGFKNVQSKVGFTLELKREQKEVSFPFLVIVARH